MLLRILILLVSLTLVACADQEATSPPATGAAVTEAPTSEPVGGRRATKAEAAPLPATATVTEAADEGDSGQGMTVLVYAQAAEESVLAAIDEMEAIGPAPEINVIVQLAGGAPGMGARRYLLASDGDPAALDSTLLAELEAGETSTASDIAAFIDWARDTYPAARLALWLWNVEGSWQESTPGGDTLGVLYLPELSTRLAAPPEEERPLELIAWDWPLAGDMATLAALQPLARSAVVPATPSRGAPWDYAAVLAALVAATAAGGPELALAVSDQLAAAGHPSGLAIDLQALPPVLAVLELLSAALQAEPALNAASVAEARGAAQLLIPVEPASGAGLPLLSLGRFAALLAQRSPDPAVTGAASRLSEALAEVVQAADDQTPGGTDPVTISFPPAAGPSNAAFAAEAPAGWADFLGSYYEVTAAVPAPSLSLLQVAGAAGGINLPVFTTFELAGRQIDSVKVVAWRLEDGSVRLVSTAFLPPERTQAAAESAPVRWRDGMHQGYYIWDTRAAYLSDGEAGEFVVLWPLAPGSSDHLVPGRLETEGRGALEQVALHFDGASGSLRATWDLAGSLPRPVTPDPGAVFSPTIYRQAADGTLLRDGGAAIRFGETGPVYTMQPLPVGDYRLEFRAETGGGAAATARADIAVNNEGYDGTSYTYLDPHQGFQFTLPAGWERPRYEDGALVSASADGSTTLVINRYPAGRRTSELRTQTLEQFGPVSTVFAESRPVAGNRGELVAYTYEGDGGPRTGVFIAFVAGENGYVVDVDGPASAESETLAVLEQIAASWLARPLGMGQVPGSWREMQLPAFTVSVPEGFNHRSLANGWELFSTEGRFVALRREPATGESRAARVQHWLDVAGEGVAAFAQEPLFQFGLGGRGWVRADFTYERDGQPVRGLVMTTVAGGEEISAWIEAPAGTGGALVDPVLLAVVAGAAGNPVEEGLLYQAAFDTLGSWGTGDQEGARGEVAGGVYRLEVSAGEGFFWTAAGESFGDGVYEVTATQLEGPLDNGYGLLLRAGTESDGFYLLAVSGDGYVWIGHCLDSCASLATLVGEGWFAHAAVSQGLAAPNRLRVVAAGEELHFFVNGELVGAASGVTVPHGDVGLFVETLGQGGVAVAFDDLRVYAR